MAAMLLCALLFPDPSPEPDPRKETRAQLVKRLGGLLHAALAKKEDSALVTHLFKEVLGRAPKPDEAKQIAEFFKKKPREDGCRDVAWALMNTKEFLSCAGLKDFQEVARLVEEVQAIWDRKKK